MADLVFFKEVSSTQDKAFELALSGAVPWTTIISEVQTAGRGQFQRPWFSKKGGLWMSVIVPCEQTGRSIHLRSDASAGQAAAPLRELPIMVGECVMEALGEIAPPGGWVDLKLKHPNDILMGGKKVCGILCEARSSLPGIVIVGIGLNVHFRKHDFPAEISDTATSLLLEGLDDSIVTYDRLIRDICTNLAAIQ